VMRRRATPSGPYTGSPPLSERLEDKRIQEQLKPIYLALGRTDLVDRVDLFRWMPAPTDPGPMWTDSYSNLLRVIHWR